MLQLLLVDDDRSFLEALSSILKQDFQVCVATGIIKAKQILLPETVDAVCSDFHMRDGTGLELLKWLREQGNITQTSHLDSTVFERKIPL